MKAPVTPEVAVAKAAGLRYISNELTGIVRHLRGKTFVYRMKEGGMVRDGETLRRIRSLAIPPAWTQVWICPLAHGHIQATGRDARGRKQYRYHAQWRTVRDEEKYGRLLAFGKALPRIRRRVSADLRRQGMGREKVLATVARLLETTLIRVGNEEYAQQNGSYGLTTLHNRHAKVRGEKITFEFKGKSGIRHRVDVQDARVAKLVRRCQDLPGQDLFGYVAEDGAVHGVTSDDVNGYLREIAGEEFSAKDFRTWAGTVLAAVALRECGESSSTRQAKRNVLRAVEAVAKMLGNTPAICRRCYVHPAILDSYFAGQSIARAAANSPRRSAALRADEAAVMALLRTKVAAPKRSRSHVRRD